MKALVKYKQGTDGLELRSIEMPTISDDELLIKVLSVGICGTDIHIRHDEYPYSAPVVLGHEYMGIVEAVGKNVDSFSQGDQVTSLTSIVSCGKCSYCNQGLNMLCNSRLSIGSGVNGAMAEYIAIPAHLAFKLPSNVVGRDMMVLAEPLTCTIRAVVEQSSVRAGDIVLISGPGAIGQLTMLVAKMQGAFVIMSGTSQDEERLKLGKELGADVTVQNKDDLEDCIKAYTVDGVDVAFECAGVAPSFDTCIHALKKTGTISQVGLYGKQILVNMDLILTKELKLTVSYATERTSWDIMLKLASQGKLDKINKLISARVPLDDWERAFEMAENKEGYKIVLVP